MMIVALVTAAAHLVQIILWAVALLLVGEISTFEKAFYSSAQNYTALGYGDIIPSEGSRSLGPLDSMPALLLFWLSSSGMSGYSSMLLYSPLHLTGVKAVSKDYEALGAPSVPLEAIKRFRQLDSRCPGHPEYRWTSGVETTTGPLGQGLATSVGMAIAGRWMAAHFNKPGFEDLIDFNVYALCGDGCMMEGISAEAASLAGHLKLSNLSRIYDN